MTTKPLSGVTPELSDLLTPAQKENLRSAVEKIVMLGAKVGVSPDEMIEMLKSGLTVRELLQYLGASTGEVA